MITEPLSHFRFMVAIETDATRYHGEHAARPGVLGRLASEQVLTHLSTDLAALFPSVRGCALAMPGALYDQTQLLRPGYPLYRCLESLLDTSPMDDGFEARLLSIGADSGNMPDAALQPSRKIPPGLLQVLPLVVNGPGPRVAELGEAMEHRFLEAGQLSAHSARALEAQFAIKVNHARFMTLTDLNAMLHLQLEHFGFLPLWDLVDAAINSPDMQIEAEGRGGQSFHWNGRAVRCRFETFDHWANHGPGRGHVDSESGLARAYAEWTREYRQYLTTLQAHHIPVEQYLPDAPAATLAGSFLVEQSAAKVPPAAAQVTEHSAGDLGTVAVSVVADGRQYNYYPLEARGLDQLHASIRESLGGSAGVAFPGGLLFDQGRRILVADSLPAS